MGFLLESHEKRFHSLSLVPLKVQRHGVLGDSQAQPFLAPRSPWVAHQRGNLLREGACCCSYPAGICELSLGLSSQLP